MPVLVIGPCTREAPEECSEGTKPTKQPMVLPVPIADLDRERKRRQGADAAQAAQPAHDRGELGLGGHDGDLCIQPVASSLDLQNRIVVRLEGHPGECASLKWPHLKP